MSIRHAKLSRFTCSFWAAISFQAAIDGTCFKINYDALFMTKPSDFINTSRLHYIIEYIFITFFVQSCVTRRAALHIRVFYYFISGVHAIVPLSFSSAIVKKHGTQVAISALLLCIDKPCGYHFDKWSTRHAKLDFKILYNYLVSVACLL